MFKAIFNNINFCRPVIKISELITREFHRKLTKKTGGGLNTHQSNKARRGLYHGKDVRSGHSVSHSKQKTKRKFYPNVIKKRVWSYALSDWVRFEMTTAALKAIDDYGGIDNYIISLDEDSVLGSPYVTKMRGLIASSLFHKGELTAKVIKRLGYDINSPPRPEIKKIKASDIASGTNSPQDVLQSI